MLNNTNQSRTILPLAKLQQRIFAATLGGLFGVFLLIGVGFAGADNFMHGAAHDARHANVFPCH